MKAVFMGTPDLAADVLRAVLASRHEVLAVVTQTDKPKGRGHSVAFSPVKEAALAHGLPVLQPERARAPEFLAQLRAYRPDIILVAAYGKILPREVLELPPFGCVNVHASLLPKYRGASPIQWAVIHGEKTSGVTIMHMEETLDTGDIILSKEVSLAPDETAGSLQKKLAKIGGPLLVEAIDALEAGCAPRRKQDEEQATYVKVLDKTAGDLDFGRPAEELERLIRGLNPWPTAYTRLDGKLLKLWRARAVSEEELSDEEKAAGPGTIAVIRKDGFGIRTGDGLLYVTELQLEGKRKMTAEEFLRGYGIKAGAVLGRQ